MQDIEKYISLMAQNQLFQGFALKEIREVISLLDGCIVEFSKGDCISELIDTKYPQMLVCILSGGALLTKYDVQGNQAVLDFAVPGFLFGFYGILTNADCGELHVMATSPGTLLCFSAQPLLSAQDMCPLLIRLNRNIMKLLAEHSWRLLVKADVTSRHSLREKVLAFLCAQRKFFHSSTFEVPLDRQQLADYLYTNRSALSRELGNLRKEGLIDFHKSRFTLLFPGE